MKRLSTLVLITLFEFAAYSQETRQTLPAAIGVHFFLNHLQYADSTGPSKYKTIKPGLAVSYMRGLTANIDMVGTLSGSYVRLPMQKNNSPNQTQEDIFIELDPQLRYRLNSLSHLISPFVQGGIGMSNYKGRLQAYVPVGVGTQVKIFEEAYFIANAQFKMQIGNADADRLYYSIGIAGAIGQKSKSRQVAQRQTSYTPMMKTDPKDSDGDGIFDDQDACPYIKGPLKYKGCPIPDSDADGINDEEDSCPHVPGLIRYHGCPIPDRDQDGTNDEQDQCPDVAGPASNSGCPVIAKDLVKMIDRAAHNIFFETNKYTLLPKSFRSLDSVATALKYDVHLKLSIEGHTDDVGSPQKNIILSTRRAAAVKTYFIHQGIDAVRLKSVGFGAEQPVADNNSETGRAANRRVELKISY